MLPKAMLLLACRHCGVVNIESTDEPDYGPCAPDHQHEWTQVPSDFAPLAGRAIAASWRRPEDDLPQDDSRREALGRIVRNAWIEWAREQPAPKASWLVRWEDLAEPDREVDRRIGERLYAIGRGDRAIEHVTTEHVTTDATKRTSHVHNPFPDCIKCRQVFESRMSPDDLSAARRIAASSRSDELTLGMLRIVLQELDDTVRERDATRAELATVVRELEANEGVANDTIMVLSTMLQSRERDARDAKTGELLRRIEEAEMRGMSARHDLARLREVAQGVLRDFGDEYEGRLAALREALDRQDGGAR